MKEEKQNPNSDIQKKVLVVDDNRDFLTLMEMVLSRANFKVLKAARAGTGIELAHREKPDLIIMDILMPMMDGIEACRALKRAQDTKDIPVIFCSANADKNLVLQAVKSGGADYIIKGFSRKVLLEKISRVLSE